MYLLIANRISELGDLEIWMLPFNYYKSSLYRMFENRNFHNLKQTNVTMAPVKRLKR